jgi:hypothetical protein
MKEQNGEDPRQLLEEPCDLSWFHESRTGGSVPLQPFHSSPYAYEATSTHPLNTFSPATPITISAMHPSRAALAGSCQSKIPNTAVPTAPIPVHTA